MIVDAFLYAGEREMLELRLRTLAPVVDVFVPVMCSLTHQGEPTEPVLPVAFEKPTNDNRGQLWAPYTVEADALPAGERGGVGSAHYQTIERQHRDGIEAACRAAGVPDDACVLVSDVDEIPSCAAAGEAELFCHTDLTEWCVLAQRFHSTALDLLHPQQPWLGTTASLMRALEPQDMRDARGALWDEGAVVDGGWHFSWFGSDEERQRKLDTFSHAELRGRFDPVEARFLRMHSNGEPLTLLSRDSWLELDWPDPITDGTFTIPRDWWAR